MANDLGFDALFDAADSDAWRKLTEGQNAPPVDDRLDAALYRQVFGTEAGQLVLADMYNRYVNVTRAVPGMGADQAFYREGMAQVVFDIVHKMTQENDG